MAAPSNKAERLCAMFDSYCKTVLRNESRDIKRALIRRSKRELAMDEPMCIVQNSSTYICNRRIPKVAEKKCRCLQQCRKTNAS